MKIDFLNLKKQLKKINNQKKRSKAKKTKH